MPDQLQLRGGTTVQHSTFTGASKEVTVDTTKKTVVVHDGTTAGGIPVMREDASNAVLALGSAATPSIKFTGDPDTGIYSPGANQVAISTNGTGRLTVGTTAVSSTLAVDYPLGAVGTPSITFTGDLNTGFWSPSADAIAASTGGSERLRIDSSGRFLVGTSSARSNFFNSTNGARFQFEGSGSNDNYALSIVSNFAGGTNGTQVILAKSGGSNVGDNTLVSDGNIIGQVTFQGADGTEFVEAAKISAVVDGTPGANDMPGRLVFFTTADGAASPTERLRITSAGVFQIADAGNITVGTTTGTKIGTATTQKLGFYNATPVVQPTAVADATTAIDVITQLNALLAKLRTLGIIAT